MFRCWTLMRLWCVRCIGFAECRSKQHAYVSAARENPDMYATLNTVGFEIGDDDDDDAF